MELEKRLGLYQVFLKIYEHNRGLLDEILQLENTSSHSLNSRVPTYVQGVIQGEQAYIITNLVNCKTQQLFQPQKTWIIGRDRRLSLSVRDPWMSRYHAAIRYVEKEGFYLVDLNSTNGSFVNGEPVYQRLLLKDGDQIRLGSVAISFFFAQSLQMLEPTPPEIMTQIDGNTPISPTTPQQTQPEAQLKDRSFTEDPEDTSIGDKHRRFVEEPTSPSSVPHLSRAERSDILDRFLGNRQTPAG